MLHAVAAATVPKVTVVLRKAYGAGYYVMCGRAYEPDLIVAWPTAEICVMGAEGAVEIVFRKQVEEAEDPAAKKAELIEAYREADRRLRRRAQRHDRRRDRPARDAADDHPRARDGGRASASSGRGSATASSRYERAAARLGTRRGASASRSRRSSCFFDLVFVLALTQCTALMADEPTWQGDRAGDARPRRALVVVGRLRLADQRRRPRGGRRAAGDLRRDGGVARRGAVRPRGASATSALLFALAYGVVRVAQIVLFVVASRDDPALRRSVRGARRSAPRSAPALLVGASFADGGAAGARCGSLALALDMGGPRSSAPRAGGSCPSTSPSATA